MVARRCRCLIAVEENKYAMLRALHEARYDLNDSYTSRAADEHEWTSDEWLQHEEKKETEEDAGVVSEEERLDAEALSYPSWFYRFTTSRAETFLHVTPKRQLNRKHVEELNEARTRDNRRPVIAIYMTGWAIDAPDHSQHHASAPADSATTLHCPPAAGADVSEATLTHTNSRRHPLSPHCPSRYCTGDTAESMRHPPSTVLVPFILQRAARIFIARPSPLHHSNSSTPHLRAALLRPPGRHTSNRLHSARRPVTCHAEGCRMDATRAESGWSSAAGEAEA